MKNINKETRKRLKLDSIYKHRKWFTCRTKTKLEAITYFVNSKDFYITLKRNINYITQLSLKAQDALKKMHISDRDEIANFLMRQKIYDDLTIACYARNSGYDSNVKNVEIFGLIMEGLNK